MRCNPPAPGMLRRTPKEEVIGEYKIPAGIAIMVRMSAVLFVSFVAKPINDTVNPLRPNNDVSQTSHCNIKGVSVSEVMRIENMITQV